MKSSIQTILQSTVILSALWATACSESEAPQPLEGVVWRLVEISENAQSYPTGSKPVTITFDQSTGQVTGFSGVNQFRGSYTVDGSIISFGPVISTRMAGPPELMKLESEILKFVSTDVGFEMTDGSLALSLGESEIARFVPANE
jgi:heat shock protein HslJ